MAPVAIPLELTRALSLDRWETLFSAFGRPAGLQGRLSHDAIDRALALAPSVPSRLRRPLARLVTLGDDAGREALLDACVDAGVDTARFPADETPAELAARALVAAEVEPEGPFSGIVDRALAHAFRLGAEESRAYEYLAKAPRVLRTAPSRQRLDTLSGMIAAWCFSHGRRRHADVRVCEEGDAIHLVVRRSRRAEPRVVLEEDGTVSARVDHPMTTDQLAIPHDGSRLSIWTSAPRMVRLYCRAVGRALFDDERYFDGPPAYSLSVLADRGTEALSVAAFAAELAEVRVIDLEWDSGVRETARLSGQDVMEALERDRIRLAGRNIGMAKLRFTRAGSGRKTSVTIWPANRVRLPRGEDEKLVRAFLEAAGIARPRPGPPSLLSLPPFIHPDRTWRAVLGARVPSLIEARALVPFQSRAVAHPDYPHEGRTLITLPVGPADELYGISMAPHVPSRRLDRAELAMLRLDLAALGREIAHELGLSGSASVVDGFDVVDLGARRLGRTTARLYLVAAHPGHEAARLGVLLHGRHPDARPVALVPGGARLDLGIPEVPVADLSAPLVHVVSDVVRALGLTAEIPAVLLAPPGARLVLDAGARLAWLDGVPLSRLTERQLALLLLLATRGEAVSAKDADEAVSPNRRIDGAAREAKRDLGAAVGQSFATAGARPPTEELVVRDGRKGYRLGVPVFVADGALLQSCSRPRAGRHGKASESRRRPWLGTGRPRSREGPSRPPRHGCAHRPRPGRASGLRSSCVAELPGQASLGSLRSAWLEGRNAGAQRGPAGQATRASGKRCGAAADIEAGAGALRPCVVDDEGGGMSSPRQEFEDCLVAPLQQHLEVPFTDERARLDALNPAVLCAKVAQGVESARSRWAGVLSPGSQQLLTELLGKSRREAEQGAALWAALNEHTNTAIFSGLVAGVTSEETATGAAIGSIFGPLGAVVGAAIGGMVAGNRVDERGKQIAAEFASWYESWIASLGAFVDHQLMPSVVSDLQRAPGAVAGGGALKVLAIAAAALALSAGAYAAWSRASSPAPSSAATPSATPATSPVVALAGRWRTTAGDELDASAVGANARFSPVLVDSKSPWSAWGPGALFTLSASPDGPSSFDVDAAVIPSFPPGVRVDPSAIERCREIWHDLRGKPLHATLEHNTLTVDIVKTDITPAGLDMQGGRVVGCKKLDPSRATRIQVTLTR